MNIYEYITTEENAYRSTPVDLQGWEWSMPEHIKKGFYYKHGRLLTGNQDSKPVKNIIRPLLNLQYRTEDIDVKDILLYVENEEKFHLSFLVKKYHDDVFVQKYNLDEVWDDCNVSRIDLGGGLLKNVDQPVPEVVPLNTIAFCDQTDMLAGPICFKHFYNQEQLLVMADKGWGDTKNGATMSLEDFAMLSEANKDNRDDTKDNKTPGKYLEVYELHGILPKNWLNDNAKPEEYEKQMHIVAYYWDEDGNKNGVTLFKGKLKKDEELLKLTIRDKVEGRALGFGGVEEIEEDQVWTNYNQIRFKELLDGASKVIHLTDDKGFYARNPNMDNVDNNSVLVVEEGANVRQMDTVPRTTNLYERWDAELSAHAQVMASASDPVLGKEAPSGTPFALQQLVTQEGKGLHEFRRGQYAKFIESVYRDWIIPYIKKEITRGKKFLSSLSMDEMEMVGEQIAMNESLRRLKEKVLNGETIAPGEKEEIYTKVLDEFNKDNNKFIELLEGELTDDEITVKINIAGKQKNMPAFVDKLVNLFRQVASAPQLLDDPRMAKLFNQILESSGLSPIEFGALRLQSAPVQQPQTNVATEPLGQLAEAQQTNAK